MLTRERIEQLDQFECGQPKLPVDKFTMAELAELKRLALLGFDDRACTLGAAIAALNLKCVLMSMQIDNYRVSLEEDPNGGFGVANAILSCEYTMKQLDTLKQLLDTYYGV